VISRAELYDSFYSHMRIQFTLHFKTPHMIFERERDKSSNANGDIIYILNLNSYAIAKLVIVHYSGISKYSLNAHKNS